MLGTLFLSVFLLSFGIVGLRACKAIQKIEGEELTPEELKELENFKDYEI